MYSNTHTHIFYAAEGLDMLEKWMGERKRGKGSACCCVITRDGVWNLDLLEIQVCSTINHIKCSFDKPKSVSLSLKYTCLAFRAGFTAEGEDFVLDSSQYLTENQV